MLSPSQCWKMSCSASSTAAGKFLTKYLGRKFSCTLQEMFVILYTGMSKLNILQVEMCGIIWCKARCAVSYQVEMCGIIYICRMKFQFFNFAARKINIFSRPAPSSGYKVRMRRNVTIDPNYYSLLSNGLVFMSNTYSCFVLSRVENYFVIEPKNRKKQIRPGKHGNTILICP